MVKEIILVRHGKAADPNDFKKDIDRVLTARGVADGYKVAARLLKEKIRPDLILTSPAARASHTALILSRAMNCPTGTVSVINNLYHSVANTFLDEIVTIPDKVNSVILVAHNPGITDLAYELTKGKISFLPTTGTAVIRLIIESWGEIESAATENFLMIKPREL